MRVVSRDRFAPALARQSSQIPLYEASEKTWLTRSRNVYGGQALNRLFNTILDETDIDHETRDFTWTSMRYRTATYFAEELWLAATGDLLRKQ